MPKLENSKHERFAHEYIKDDNATQAYIRAGYSKNGARQGGQRLLTKVDIMARIEELKAPILEKCKVDTEWIIDSLVGVFEKSYAEKPVLDKDGEETGEYRFDSAGANSALDKLAKIMGSYAPEKQEVEHNINEIKFTLVKPK